MGLMVGSNSAEGCEGLPHVPRDSDMREKRTSQGYKRCGQRLRRKHIPFSQHHTALLFGHSSRLSSEDFH